jgi:glucose/arabinose dehydrogenase
MKRSRSLIALAAVSFWLLPIVSQAQDNLIKPGQFKVTNTRAHTYIDQNSADAAAVRETLKRIKLPPGFKIELYAIVPDARHMAMASQGTILFVGTTNTKVWAAIDRNRDHFADEVKDFAPSLAFDVPNGVAFSKDGFLFIAERNRVMMYPAAEFFQENPDVVAVPIVPEGSLVPIYEESYSHTARVVKVGPDNKLYMSLGQPYNVAPANTLDLYNETGIGGIIRLDRDGKNREVFTYGVRNSVGHDFESGKWRTMVHGQSG